MIAIPRIVAMPAGRSRRLIRLVGVLGGLALAGWLVLAERVPEGTGRLGADVAVTVVSGGELSLSPTAPRLVAADLDAGERPRRALRLVARNQTGRPLAVRVLTLPSTRRLDRSLRMRLRSGRRVLGVGPVGRLRGVSARAFLVPKGASRALTAEIWIPRSASAHYRGRVLDLGLELRARPVAAGR